MCGLTTDDPPRWDRRNARWKGDLAMTFVTGLNGGSKARAGHKTQYMKAFMHADAASQQADAVGTALALVRSRCATYQPPGKVQKRQCGYTVLQPKAIAPLRERFYMLTCN